MFFLLMLGLFEDDFVFILLPYKRFYLIMKIGLKASSLRKEKPKSLFLIKRLA